MEIKDKESKMSAPNFEEETQVDRLSRKAKDAPFMVAGLVGLTGVVGYGLYGLRQRKIPLSIYLIQMRVGAQGFVVSCLTLGIAYSMFKEYVYPKLTSSISNDSSSSKSTTEN